MSAQTWRLPVFARGSYTHTNCNLSWSVQLSHRCLWSLQNFSRSWLVCGSQCWERSSSVTHAPVLSATSPFTSFFLHQLTFRRALSRVSTRQCYRCPAPPSQQCLQPLWAGGLKSSQGWCRLRQERLSEFNLLTEIQYFYRFPGYFCVFLSLLCGRGKLCCLCSIYSGFPKGKCAANKRTGMQKSGSCFRTVREALLQTNEPSICSKTLFSKHSMKTVILPGWSLEER